MIDVAEALNCVEGRAAHLPAKRQVAAQAVGKVLAESIPSDVDSPPYDKALMDGYAVIADDFKNGHARCRVLEEVTAGDVPRRTVVQGTATRIMTGAPLPDGADAVVMVERTELLDDKTVQIHQAVVKAGQNVMPQGLSMRAGEVVLRPGHRISAIDVGLLHEVGRDEVLVYPAPTVAILPTGNELVSSPAKPSHGQIRNSNGPMLCAMTEKAGGIAVDLGIGRDDREELANLISRGLEEDVLILSGGVSAGVLDLVPGVLRDLGCSEVFHKVKLKPGKPLWFGTFQRGDRQTLVFGLPGNPVSSLVCFELFVRPAISILSGTNKGLDAIDAVLEGEHSQKGDRPTYFPGVLRFDQGQALVRTLSWQGSADLRTLAQANSLICFPEGRGHFADGQLMRVLRLPVD